MSDKTKRIIKIVAIVTGIVVALIVALIVYRINRIVPTNPEDAVGNTAGNLYNGGYFCEVDGYVYFANPDDGYALYRMKADGSELKLIKDDNCSYINIYGKYIYYRRHDTDQITALFHGTLYGVIRCKLNGSKEKILHEGIVDNVVLLGNRVYYQNYVNLSDTATAFYFSYVDLQGKEDEDISQTAYVPTLAYDGKLYFCDVKETHNLLVYDPKAEEITTFLAGNIYEPDIYDGCLYYIDLDNNHALTKYDILTHDKVILSGSDYVVNYNLGGDFGVIYYQAENSTTDHKLVVTNLAGTYSLTVMEGDYCDINITSVYTYFFRISGDSRILYRTATGSASVPEKYTFATD